MPIAVSLPPCAWHQEVSVCSTENKLEKSKQTEKSADQKFMLNLKELGRVAGLAKGCSCAQNFIKKFEARYPSSSASHPEPYPSEKEGEKRKFIGEVRQWIMQQRLHANKLLAEAHNQALNPTRKANTNNDAPPTLTTHSSYAELWAVLAYFIGKVKSEYVDFYGDLMQAYTEMYEEYNNTVQKGASDSVYTVSTENSVGFDQSTMGSAYGSFNEWLKSHNPQLGSIPNWDELDEAGKNEFINNLSPAFNVDYSTGQITFNTDQYAKVDGTFPGNYTIIVGKTIVSLPVYNSWLATFNAVGSAFQSNMQTFAQRFSQANTSFDNLNRTLSSMISSTSESAKDVLKSIN